MKIELQSEETIALCAETDAEQYQLRDLLLQIEKSGQVKPVFLTWGEPFVTNEKCYIIDSTKVRVLKLPLHVR